MKVEERMKKWMIKNWGERCPDYCRDCGCCEAWKCYDFIFKIESKRERNNWG